MDLNLENREWKKFRIGKIFRICNSKPYHNINLEFAESKDGISYITRTNLNNGLESVVKKASNFKINPPNTIAFGAENATFFFQPNEYITGNKIYFIESKNLNKYIGLFIQTVLNNSIKNSGFGFGKGLIGSRVMKRYTLLPTNSQGLPDYAFMEEYIKEKEKKLLSRYKVRIQNVKEVEPLENKEWGEFKLERIFNIFTGGDLIISRIKQGNIPIISHSVLNNGVVEWTSKIDKERLFSPNNTLSLADRGNFHAFTQNKDFYIGTRVKALQAKFSNPNRFILSYIATMINLQSIKFSYGKNATKGIGKLKILLPINSQGLPDFVYMENYIKQIENRKLQEYLDYKDINN